MNAWPGSFLWVLISCLALACLIAAIVHWCIKRDHEALMKKMDKDREEFNARIMKQSQQYMAARKNYPRSSFSSSSSDRSSSVNDAIIYSSLYDSSSSALSSWSDSSSYSSDSSSSSCSDSSSYSSSDSSSSSCSSSSSFD